MQNKKKIVVIKVDQRNILQESGETTVEFKLGQDIDYSKCKWTYNNSNEQLGTEDKTKYDKQMQSANDTETIENLGVGTYYLHVLAVDKNNNEWEKISEAFYVASVNVDRVELDKASIALTLEETEEAEVTVTVYPENATDKRVTWRSEDETVATVELKNAQNDKVALVKAVGLGTTAIHATSTEGGHEADCQITVSEISDDVYAILYEDGTLAFNRTGVLKQGKTVKKNYGNIKNEEFTSDTKSLWYEYYDSEADSITAITSVDIEQIIKPQSTAYWFYGCKELTSIDLTKLKTENVTNMRYMFNRCEGLTSLNLSNFITENVTSMNSMFRYCYGLTSLDLSNFTTENVSDISYMFNGCKELITIYAGNWNLESSTSAQSTYSNCSKLTGEKGTTVQDTSATTSINYSKLDEEGSPGYFSSKPST